MLSTALGDYTERSSTDLEESTTESHGSGRDDFDMKGDEEKSFSWQHYGLAMWCGPFVSLSLGHNIDTTGSCLPGGDLPNWRSMARDGCRSLPALWFPWFLRN